MSRYHFSTRNFKVLLGYDHPLNHFFITIFKENDEDEVVYSNLDEEFEADAFPRDINVIKKIAARFELNIPREMWKEIQNDGINQVGNKEVYYTENGRRISL